MCLLLTTIRSNRTEKKKKSSSQWDCCHELYFTTLTHSHYWLFLKENPWEYECIFLIYTLQTRMFLPVPTNRMSHVSQSGWPENNNSFCESLWDWKQELLNTKRGFSLNLNHMRTTHHQPPGKKVAVCDCQPLQS